MAGGVWVRRRGGLPYEASGQVYPSKPIRVIVPFAPGGGADLVGRLVAQKLTEALKQQAIVDNRAGAAGRIGAELVAKAPADGYTLLMATTSLMITAPALYAKLPYDVQKDFAPVTLLASGSYVLVVHPSVPAKTVSELIAIAKSKKGALNYASSGPGGPAHLAAELFKSMAGVDMTHIAYKGSAPGTMAVLAGETDLMFSNISPAIPAIQSKRLRGIAITSERRSSMLPELPTVAESGLPGFRVETLYALLAPAATPHDVIAQLNAELVKAFDSAEVRKRLASDGTEAMVSSPENLGKLIRDETRIWTKVIRDAGIKPE
jgi:tripartite-type tricarboxylate transporter receptor subunit TctC